MAKKKKKKEKPKTKPPHKIRWDRQSLGKKSDRSIARKLGVAPAVVRHHRMRLGIPVAEASKFALIKGIDWDNEKRLGKMFDTHLAKELGVSGAAVRKARQRRDIPLFKGKRKHRPKHGDKKLTARGGVDWDNEPLLGQMSDSDLAKKYGLGRASVQKARHARGIPAPPDNQASPIGYKQSRSTIGVDWDKEPLGKMVDRDLAFMLGCSSQAVAYARAERGIAPYRKKRGVTWTNN